MSTVDLVIVIMRRGERRAGKLFRDRVKQIFKVQNFPYIFFIENCSPQPPIPFTWKIPCFLFQFCFCDLPPSSRLQYRWGENSEDAVLLSVSQLARPVLAGTDNRRGEF